MKPKLPRCPICEKEFDPQGVTSLPFCSERCRKIDLGRWLRESYGMPVERAEEDSVADDYPTDSD